ncbi:MAG: hypothetical protein ACTHKU_15570, partial [Verrucomicrobiota bacterium]
QVTLLTFDKNGAKPVASAAPAGGLPVPRQIPFPALPGAPGSTAPGGAHSIPTRTVRTGEQSQANPAIGSNVGSSINAGGQTGIQTAVPYEEQVIMIEAQRMQLQQAGKDQDANMFPITEMTPETTSGGQSPF